jgi:heme/copper-type cytochrome/quinol oxidase subunit 3
MSAALTRPAIDVSELPPSAVDHRSPIWWGNLLLLVIETTMFAILVATYFYIRINFEQWPPIQSNAFPPDRHPVPDLFWGTTNLLVILGAGAAMVVADRAALRADRKWVLLGGGTTVLLALLAMVLRFQEFHGIKFRWDENAYASVVWGILVMHFIHLIVGAAEDLLMTAYVSIYGLYDKHSRDVRVTAVYWYWIGGIWLPLYTIIYFVPYWL